MDRSEEKRPTRAEFRIDMRDHAGAFPSIRAAGVNALGVERAFELMNGGT